METFLAYRVHRDDGKTEGRLERITLDDLDEGDVVIRAAWSGINYKDALAATGAGKIMRRFPMVGGIDVAGVVHASNDARYAEGDSVVVTGFGLSEEHDGGYAEYVRASGDWLIPLPDGMSLRDSMAIGTAGFTAALAVDAMELNGQRPDAGPVLVNGATGGVGSFAIDMLGGLGYEVTAFTGKRDQNEYLHALGATDILYRDEVEMGTRPLEKALWAGAVDNVGGDQLAWLTRHHAARRQHRVHRPRGRVQARNHGHAVHPARGEPARHQQRPRRAGTAGTGVAAPRFGPESAQPRTHRDVRSRAVGASRRVRRISRRSGHRPCGGAHRRVSELPRGPCRARTGG